MIEWKYCVCKQPASIQNSVLVFLLQLFCVVWAYSDELREKKKKTFAILFSLHLNETRFLVHRSQYCRKIFFFFFLHLTTKIKKIIGLSQSMYIVTVCWTVGILFFGCLLVTLYSPCSKSIVMIYSSYEICILFIVISCYSHDNATMIFYSQVMLLNILQLRKMWEVGFNEICCCFENFRNWCFTEEY